MGRHGAGQSSQRPARVSIPLVVIGLLVVAAVGFGIWLWKVRSVTDPIDAQPVDAYAVVVSSPACTSGSGTTVIDLSLSPVIRSSLNACGQRTGARLAVQYLQGHPDQVRLAGTTIARNSPLGRWLPIAILAAGLLAVVATIALLIERRQSRHTGQRSRVTVAQLRAGNDSPTPGAVVSARHAERESPVGQPAEGSVPETAPASPPAPDAQTTSPEPDAGRSNTNGAPVVAPGLNGSPSAEISADETSRIAIPGFAGPGSAQFRPSEIIVQPEDLFTHRGPEAPDR